ncbi:YjbH domain-containing protein [Gammaproteobacteria bacterium]|nr:YjbH domain-containing protein [Gammaproteobacteria bacterium]MDC1277695.1 YjbH domain-containing protein [Gammaproteobacteria bacterium]
MHLQFPQLLLLLLLTPVYCFPAYYVKNSYSPTSSSFNSIGQTGLIHLPSASLQDSGTVGLTIGKGSLNELMSIIATPFPWLEASFFYHRPRDTFYLKKNKYLDKGFNLKLGFNYKGVDIAMGLDDIAGTGFFTKEYLVATTSRDNFIITAGVGTGALAADHPYKNPISRFRERPKSKGSNFGGELDYSSFFRGPVGLFGGVEFFSTRFPGLTIKIESNPFDYNQFLAGGFFPTNKFRNKRRKQKDYNYGFSYKFKNDFVLSLSEVNGNSFDISLSAKFNFNGRISPVQPKKVELTSNAKDSKLAFYQNILRNLENDELFLQSAELDNKNNLHLAIVNNKYNNSVSVFKHIKLVTLELATLQNIPLSNLSITNINSGMETSKITAKVKNRLAPEKIGYMDIDVPENNTKEFDFQTILNFPEFYNSIKPEFIYRYADPTRFFAGGVDLILNSEIKFSPGLYLTTAISYQLTNSFKRLRYYPDSPYLPHVRTDVVKYLNNRPDIYLNSMQLDKLSKISNDHYLKFSAGMYEMMFGGYGVEYFWKPFTSNLSIGLSLYQVKQRDFQQRLKFRDYQISTGHSNFIYFHPETGLTLDLSFGKYLAGDKGYTFDFSRRFKSGFEMGAYFTRTNISKKTYGEGSFDKGFYFEMPLNIFDINASKGITNFTIQPLTRDGGAKLKTNNPLIYSIISGSESDYNFYTD